MSKRVLALLLTIVMVATCLPVSVVAEPQSKAHIHCVCGKQTTLNATCDSCGETAVEWTAAEAMPTTAGYYYLTAGISAEQVEYKGSVKVAICLHGQTVTSTNGGQILAVGGGAKVTITDCAEEQGTFTGCSTYAYGSVMRAKKGGTLIMYGGKVTGNTAPSTGDGTIYVDKGDSTTPGGAFYMYGGEISGNTARRGAGVGSASSKSPDLPGSIHILGGTITGNTGTGTGGTKGGAGILAFCPVEIGGNAQIYGNTATEGPDDIYLRNTSGYQGALIVSSAKPLSADASVSFGADSGDLSGLSGTPSDWSCSWLNYEGQTVSYTGNGFVLGHFHGEQEYTPITDNVGMKNAQGYCYLTKDLKLGGEQTRSKDLHLCLNGHIIQAANNKRIFGSSASTPMSFHIEDCSAYTDDDGVYHAGKLTGGNNSAGSGGAMAIVAGNKLYLHDGIITDNNAGAGGALLISGEFYMQGGVISNNTAKTDDTWKTGGALQINKGGKVVISDGKIVGNEAAKGSAVYAPNACTLEISGGIITGNTSYENGAIYVGEDATVTLSGAPEIHDNKLDEAQNNVYLADDAVLTVGQMESSAKIGVTAQNSGRAISKACDDYSKYFTSDNAEYKVLYLGGTLFLDVPVTHIHCICGGTSCTDHESAGFAAWKGTPTGGSYYLTEDVVLTDVITVTSNMQLCLNGHTITQTGAKRIFEVEENVTLTITDCAASYNDDTYAGGQIVGGVNDTGAAFLLKEGATFNLYGGRITGSKPAAMDKATAGAAIFLRSSKGAGTTFNMYGGEITGNGNEKSWGGAVSNGSGSAENAVYVNIYGGKIFGNASGTGGAIRLENKGVLTICGGQLCDNTATNSGGAIYLSKGAQLDLQGGQISGNAALLGGGIYTTMSAGEIKVSGAPVVADNTVSGKQNNLYLNGDLNITLGDMGEGAKLGITAAKSGRAISTQTENDYTANFYSDSAYKSITYQDQTLYLAEATGHQHCACAGAATGCDHAGQVWTAWESVSTLPTTSGYYYLTEDVQLTAIVKLEADQNIYLCLNGKTVIAAENTGHMILAKGTVLSVTDCSETPGGFTGGNKNYGGSVNVVAGATMNLYGGRFYGNTAPDGEGGAIYLQGGNNNNGALPGGIFNMYGGKVHDNTAGVGGGIRAAGLGTGGETPSQLNIYGGEISANKTLYKLDENGEKTSAQGEGAAIAATNGTEVNIYGGEISTNIAEDDGGAIYANKEAKINIKGGSLLNNEARYGGAIFTTSAGTIVNMDGGELNGNQANAGGAVMLQSNSVFTMNGGKICNNSASSGAGLYVSTNTEFVMNGGQIEGNTATASGAGFYALRSRIKLNGGEITGNKAVNRGGAFVSSGATVEINKCTISGNSAKEGGAAYFNRSSSKLSDGTYNYYPSVATINEGALITGNTAETNCGGFVIGNAGVVVTMNGGQITKNTAKNGGGVMTWTGATFVMKGGSISGNTASIHGGGMYISTGSTFRMEGGSVSGNTARNGGGIYMLRSNGEFIGGSVSNNYAQPKITWKNGEEVRTGGSAGAMYMSGADCNLRGTNFTGNHAEANGGAIVMGRNTYTKNGIKHYDNTSLNIYDGVFSGNTSVKAAGALLIQSKETVVNMYGGTFTGNTSQSAAGAIYVSTDTTFNMTGGSIVKNRSETTGGGIYILRSKATITGGEIHSNTSKSSGAQLVTSGNTAKVLLKNMKFHSGATKIGGALVVQSQAQFTAENCEFYNNTTDNSGGAVYVSTRTCADFVGCKFYNNVTKGTGGALTAANFSKVNITDCEFINNASGTMGGAVYANPVSTTTIKNVTISNCTAGTRGGAITCRGTMFLIDSVIENCSAKEEGGAVYTDTNTAGGSGVMRGLVVEGSEIRNNTAGGMGGAFYIYKGCRLELYDTKITGNTSPAEGGAIWAYEDVELHDTQITGNTSGGVGYAVYMNDANYDGHSYFANHNKLSGNTIIKDNQGGDLWMGPDVVFAIASSGLGENVHINLVMDSGVVTSRILGAYNYEGGNQIYTITYGDRSMTDPELLPQSQEEPTENVEPTTEEPLEENDKGNAMLYVGIGCIAAVVVIAAVVLVLITKKKSAKNGLK